MNTNTSTTKPKIQKTNRILFRKYTIYTSCDVVREVRDLLVRVNQKLAPKRGEGDNLWGRLQEMANSDRWKDHFANSSRQTLTRSFFN